MEKTLDFIKENEKRYVDELAEWLKIESISSDSTKDPEMRRAGEWLVDKLNRMGFENAKLMETGGKPIVYADWLHAEGKPTILVYGHYDVQPVDPVDLWDSPPFEPSIRDGKIYARGSSDDKGQFLTHVFALEALLKQTGKLPVNIKFLVEGEEECGGGSTFEFVEKNRDLLACDAITISDTEWYSAEVPTIIYGLRGISYMEFIIRGPNRDLHSGSYGGIVQNPLNAVGQIIAKLHDEKGRVRVPGFYDDVVPLSEDERRGFAEVGDRDQAVKSELGLDELWGEEGYTAIERGTARPTMDVNGMWGGFSGEGSKTVIPTHGGFKVSARLVANQSPEKVWELTKKYVEEICPLGVKVESKFHHGGEPLLVSTDNGFIKAAASAFEKTFGKKPAFLREGVAVPITNALMNVLNAYPVLVGYGLPDDALHSPNEKLNLDSFQNGIICNAYMYEEFGV